MKSYTVRYNLGYRDEQLLAKIKDGITITYQNAQKLIILGLIYQQGQQYKLTFAGEQITR